MDYRIYDTKNSIGDIRFEKIYTILSSSLPQCEMRSKEKQRQLLSDDRYHIITAEDNGEIVGFIALWKLTGVYFIEHFAVDNTKRNCGIGAGLLEYCINVFAPVVLEVEPENSSPEARRRIGFYKRNGFAYNDYEYYQPPMQDGFDLLPLKIMSYPDILDVNDFEKVRSILYREIYNF